jgi:hypothetical protein
MAAGGGGELQTKAAVGEAALQVGGEQVDDPLDFGQG